MKATDLLGHSGDPFADGRGFIQLVACSQYLDGMSDEEFIAWTLDRRGDGRMKILQDVARAGTHHMKNWEFPTLTFYCNLPGIAWRHIMPYRLRTISQRASKRVYPPYEFPDDYWIHPQFTDQQKIKVKAMFQTSQLNYERLVSDGVRPQDARIVLPQLALYDARFWKMDSKAWRHFLEQRLPPDAQYPVRQVARCIYDNFYKKIFTHTEQTTPIFDST